MDIVKVKNTSEDRPLKLRNRKHATPGNKNGIVEIAPGSELTLPFDYVVVNFGHPRSQNTDKEQTRAVEFKHLRTKWGFYSGIHPEDAWTGSAPMRATGEVVGPFKPEYEVRDLDDNRLYTVLEDPQGLHAAEMNGVSLSANDGVNTEKRIKDLEAQIRKLTDIQNMQQQQQAPTPSNPNPQPQGDGDSGEQTQEQRNEERETIPAPKAGSGTPKKDSPRTTRSGR